MVKKTIIDDIDIVLPGERTQRRKQGKEAQKTGGPSLGAPEWRKQLRETALSLYDYGFNVVPVNEDKRPISSTWSNKQRISRGELEQKLGQAVGIAVIGGDVNPWGEKYRLVIVDVDAPRTALEKSPKLKELVEISVSWRTGPRCPSCGAKHFEVLENEILKCKRCGHVFGLSEAKERGLGVMFLVEKEVAEKYGLKRTLRKGEVEFLVENYQLIPPSRHRYGVQYEWINPLSLDKPFAGIVILSEKELSQLLRETGEEKQEEKTAEPAKETQKQVQLRELTNTEILKAVEALRNIYIPGYRQMIWLYLSGWGAKAGISPISIAQILITLYSELQDEDNIKTRGSALVYSYKKAGIDLVPYWDKLKDILGEEPYGAPSEASEESIKGFTGLQEIAEKVFEAKSMNKEEAEQKALEIINTISEIFGTASPFRDSVFEIMNYEKQIYAVANLNKLVVVRAKRTKEGIRYMEKVFIGAPTRVIKYISPIGGVTKYEVTWEIQGGRPLHIGPAYTDEILDRLRIENLIANSRIASDVFATIINGYERRGLVEVKTELESPGFYYLNGKLVAVKVDTERPSKDELKAALELLNELGTKWFSHIQDRFSDMVVWGAIAPFIFAYKQKYGAWIKWRYLYGAPKTGKTTLGEIVLSIWGLDVRFLKSGANIDTSARLGYILSFSTFPTIINEPGGALSKEDVVEALKSSIESVTARGKYHKGSYIDIPALSPLLFTSNKYLPRDEALARRLRIHTFTYGERLSEEKIQEFEEKVKPRLKKMKAIGKYVASRIMTDDLQENLMAQGRRILEDAYREAGLTPPGWLYLETSETGEEDIYEDLKERIRGFLLRRINEEYNRFVGRIAVQTETNIKEIKREDTDLKQRIGIVIEQRLIPWLFGKGEEVYITSGIIHELEKEIGDIGGLKSLAELLEWGYTKKSIRLQGRKLTNYLIYTQLETFMEFLAIDIAEEKTAEN